MNTLHRVGKKLESGMIAHSSGLTHLQWEREARLALDMYRDAVVFDIGDVGNIALRDTDCCCALNLPFPVTYFDMHGLDADSNRVDFGLLVWEHEEKDCAGVTLDLRFVLFHTGKHVGMCDFGHFPKNAVQPDGSVLMVSGNRAQQFISATAISFAAKAMAILASPGVERVETKPSRLAIMQARKSGVPVFSTWTLHLKPEKPAKGEPLGGTHASPRVHLRRGHFRTCKSGVRVWVQPCVVGSKHGMIHKDYRLVA